MATYKGQYAYYENHTLQITDDAALYLHAADSDPEKETVLATSINCYDNVADILLLTLCIFLPAFTLYNWCAQKTLQTVSCY